MNKGYKVEIQGVEKLQRIFDKFPDVFRDEIKTPLKKIGFEVEKESKAEAPVFMGTLRASITNEVNIGGDQANVRIGTGLQGTIYPVVMEFGRRPGSKNPPPQALIRWVHLVLQPDPDKELITAIRLSRAIGKRGIKGREYMKKGMNKALPKMSGWISDAVNKMMERINRGS